MTALLLMILAALAAIATGSGVTAILTMLWEAPPPAPRPARVRRGG